MIHLKRFSFKGPFTDKIESFVDFPMKDLDLTNYMPFMDASLEAKLPPDDARAQIPPFKYDLYAVTNHFGSLSSGHCMLFIFITYQPTDFRFQTPLSSLRGADGCIVTIAKPLT